MFTKINAYKKDLWHKKIWEKNFPDLCKPKVNFDLCSNCFAAVLNTSVSQV